MIRAVFFDFVGTLITKRGENVTHQNIVREVLKRAGREDLNYMKLWEEYEAESGALFKELAGKPYVKIREVDTEAMRRVAKKYGFNVPDDFWGISIEMHRRYGELFPDAREALSAMKSLGLHLGIITDSDNDYIRAHLDALGLLDAFDSITTSEDAGFYKPHERVFQLALTRAGVKPEEAIYVGDNPLKDCVGARKVDMISVLLDPDAAKRELWGNCDFTVSNLREVVEIVRGLND
jgi:HAD superfamily hydrolase (TIGR02253 family)